MGCPNTGEPSQDVAGSATDFEMTVVALLMAPLRQDVDLHQQKETLRGVLSILWQNYKRLQAEKAD